MMSHSYLWIFMYLLWSFRFDLFLFRTGRGKGKSPYLMIVSLYFSINAEQTSLTL